MGQKIVVGPYTRGLRNDVTAFNIDNNSFPFLLNAYQWRGRIKRKRGTRLLGRLQRFIETTDGAGAATITIVPFPIPAGQVSFTVGSNIFTDPGGPDPVTLLTNGPGTAELTRSTGTLVIAGSNIDTPVIYFPTLPVMGLEDWVNNAGTVQYPGTIAFDTRKAYNISTRSPYPIYDVSYYKNPPSTSYAASYVAKAASTPFYWNGNDYQQFWSTNYESAFWVTNGIAIPFSSTNVGMQFAPSSTIVFVSQTATTIVLTITNCPLVVGDFVFLNEWTSGTPANAVTLNFQTGYVTAIAGTPASLTVTITLPNAAIATDTYIPGIVQYLTNSSDNTKDCIRWYDGDPTNGVFPYSTLNSGLGWVNFTPPLSQGLYSIADEIPHQYYLVGARMIVPFKDRILFLGAVIQASTGAPIYTKDTIVYSWNGTPYYTASFQGTPINPTTIIPILTPDDETAFPTAFWEDQTGFGGFVRPGIDQELVTVGINKDALIVGFTRLQTRLIYTSNDIVPFAFYAVNSELGSGSTFSSIIMDQGVITIGSRGYIITSQDGTQRIDLEIPDLVFQISGVNNGNERICSQRDYQNEWIYFTYPSNQNDYVYPTQTLFYNYRDSSWAMFDESYTTYGTFRQITGDTWATIGLTFPAWREWQSPWNAGEITLGKPDVIAGNQEGFVLFRLTNTTEEAPSLTIQNIVGSTVTVPNHTLVAQDFILIQGTIGTVSAEVNGKLFQVIVVDNNTFTLDPPISNGLTYLGGGTITEMYQPYIQTKQFPIAWEMARKTRLGPQQYLFTTTDDGEVQLLIFLSQDANTGYNDGPIFPDPNSSNNGLIYSTVLYTCPESCNLGLTPFNSSLQSLNFINSTGTNASSPQSQIWHRLNTSLIGDTVQVGITLSQAQMLALDQVGEPVTITGATNTYPAVLTANNNFEVGQLIQISGVQGMTQLNFGQGPGLNNYIITAVSSTTITIDVDATGFGTYTMGGSAIQVDTVNQFNEIELHGMILDVNPSQVLA